MVLVGVSRGHNTDHAGDQPTRDQPVTRQPVTNDEVARAFADMATALELLGANRFRTASNSRVAREIRDMTTNLADLVNEDPATAVARLCALPGIGKGSAEKIVELMETGAMNEHQKLMAEVPRGLFDVLDVPGIGPKAARVMWQELEIESVDDLMAQIDTEAFRALPRMGEKTIANIKEAVAFRAQTASRTPIGQALPIAREIHEALAALPGVERAAYAGSLRRGEETIGDLDFLVSSSEPEAVAEFFVNAEGVTKVLAHGATKCSVRLERGRVAIQADLRLVPLEAFGAALMYFTGSKEHNVRMRERSIKRGMRLNEYGLFEGNEERPQDLGKAPVAAADEEAIYAALELPFIPPELRQGHAELDQPPTARLIELNDIKAELHAHTVASDGSMSIEELAQCARNRGYHTIAVTDHSVSQVIANGLDADRLRDHVDAVRAVAARIEDISVLAGSEVDILADGSLDYDDEILALLDVVVASPHAALRQDPEAATARLLKAIAHPLVRIIGHPTGRLINRREGLSPDMSALYRAAAEHDTALELNANSQRLDLRDRHVRGAREQGCAIALDTDAHREENFDQLVYGVLTARRAGLEPEGCINTWPAEKLHTWLRAGR